MKRLFLNQIASDSGRLTSKVKVSAHGLARDWPIAAKGVIVEGVAGLVQLLAQAVVGLVEVEGSAVVVVIGWPKTTEWIVTVKHTTPAGLIARQVGIEAEEGHYGGVGAEDLVSECRGPGVK